MLAFFNSTAIVRNIMGKGGRRYLSRPTVRFFMTADKMTAHGLVGKIIFIEYIGFAVVIFFIWIDEVLDLPYHLLGAPPTPVNYIESVFETAIIVPLALFVIRMTSHILNKMEHLAMYDPLTDLMNRRFLTEYLKHKVHKPSRSKRPFSLIMCDIDDFKRINDRFGHECGDGVLQEVATILKEITRPQDLVSRWGGEEFLIFLPDISAGSATDMAERLRVEISDHLFHCNDQQFSLTMSFGVSDHVFGQSGSEGCIRDADEKLYEAKRIGKNRVVRILDR